ncbi:glycosyltransferase [Kineococcus gynurae]|uniref:glycosyltransferase n=1 Tax=Kineococcus gynurae TaxID=452979 RepID=UPI0035EC28A6
MSHDFAFRWTREGHRVRFLVLEAVADGPGVFTPEPELDVVFASPRPGRFRRTAPRILAETFGQVRRADVVVSGSEVGYQLLFGWLATRVLRKRFVMLVQSRLPDAVAAWTPGRLRPLLSFVHRRVDAAVCVSPGLVPDVLAAGVPAERIHVARVGIDSDEVLRRAGRDGGPERGSRPRIVAVGRLARQKGFDVLLDAFARARGAGLDAELVVVGEGEEREALEAQAAELGVADRVHLPGHVPDAQTIIAGADLFVLSSRYEGLGLVLLEALAHGVPVIATDCPTGPRHVLDDGRHGELVPVEDADALGRAIRRHFERPQDRRGGGVPSQQRARTFDQAAAAEDLAAYLESLASTG